MADLVLSDSGASNWSDALSKLLAALGVGASKVVGFALLAPETGVNATKVVGFTVLAGPYEQLLLDDGGSNWADARALGYGIRLSDTESGNWLDSSAADSSGLGSGFSDDLNSWLDALALGYGLWLADSDSSWADAYSQTLTGGGTPINVSCVDSAATLWQDAFGQVLAALGVGASKVVGFTVLAPLPGVNVTKLVGFVVLQSTPTPLVLSDTGESNWQDAFTTRLGVQTKQNQLGLIWGPMSRRVGRNLV